MCGCDCPSPHGRLIFSRARCSLCPTNSPPTLIVTVLFLHLSCSPDSPALHCYARSGFMVLLLFLPHLLATGMPFLVRHDELLWTLSLYWRHRRWPPLPLMVSVNSIPRRSPHRHPPLRLSPDAGVSIGFDAPLSCRRLRRLTPSTPPHVPPRPPTLPASPPSQMWCTSGVTADRLRVVLFTFATPFAASSTSIGFLLKSLRQIHFIVLALYASRPKTVLERV
ncbi:hypothetical protein BD309DRAFT_454430 [Dichomitus squalens]|nr:hypothetical protein BD309DRAFT_454430 [Dichomitus squalens]